MKNDDDDDDGICAPVRILTDDLSPAFRSARLQIPHFHRDWIPFLPEIIFSNTNSHTQNLPRHHFPLNASTIREENSRWAQEKKIPNGSIKHSTHRQTQNALPHTLSLLGFVVARPLAAPFCLVLLLRCGHRLREKSIKSTESSSLCVPTNRAARLFFSAGSYVAGSRHYLSR